MKKFQYLALIVLMSTASQSFAKTGTVIFNGEVTAETCTANVNGTGGAANTVTLPTVALGSLATANSTAGDTQFGIKIVNAANKTCDVKNTVSGIYFEPSSLQVNSAGRLNNSDATGATGVQIRLLNNAKQPIDLTKNYGAQEASTVNNDDVFNYYAQYYATGITATAGKLVSEVDFTIIYK